jgi:hypothetical protein
MPVQFKQTLTVKTIEGDSVNILSDDITNVVRAKSEAGHYIFFKRDEPVVTVTDVAAQCDNPKCPNPQVYTWNQEKAAEGSDEVPDAMYRTVGIKLFDGSEKMFCGVKCATGYLSGMAPLRSPREKRLVDKVMCISDAKNL